MGENGKLTGRVIWFDGKEKKYGFIDVDGSADNLFVHLSDVVRSNIDPEDLTQGAKVKFRRIPSPKNKNSFCASELELA